MELTYLSEQWQPPVEPPLYSFWMASSEVDQKFLGHFAKVTTTENNYLSRCVRTRPLVYRHSNPDASFLFRVLGLSVILAEKLVRARKAKRLDPVRDPKARHLVHHILWLAREGLVMVEQYVLPMVGHYVELKVLSYKLKASFYHIFVLFHNDPPVNDRINRSRSGGSFSLFPDPLSPRPSKPPSREPTTRSSTSRQRSPAISLGGPVGGTMTRTPPGLPPPSSHAHSARTEHNGTANFLLPLQDYTPHATAAFKEANDLAERLLPGSHPIRLSVKVEYVAYVYDCLHEAEASRRMARMSIRHVYEAQEGMDDESFEDAAEMVEILGRMMRRGLGTGSGQGSSGSQQAVESRERVVAPSGSRNRPVSSSMTQQPTTWV